MRINKSLITYIPSSGSGSGTVTSVALSSTMPTGLTATITGSPITSSGTINLSLAFSAGYSIPTNTKQSNWDDAYTFVGNFPTQSGNSGKYLTTNGSALSWATLDFSNITGTVPVTKGGTGVATLTGVVIGNGTGNFSAVTGGPLQILRVNASATGYEFFNATYLTNPMTALGDIIIGAGAGVPSRLAGNTTTTKMFLSSTGTGSAATSPVWEQIDMTDLYGTLNVGKGGTGATSLSGVLIGNGTSAFTATSSVTSGQLLRVNTLGTGYEFFTPSFLTPIDIIATTPLVWNSGTNTMSIPQANNSTNGFLSSADWLTFSSKQPAITLTTTGSSGASTFNVITGALNIPEYTLIGLGGFANPMTTAGDIMIARSTGEPERFAGNNTTTRKYFSQIGDGTSVISSSWETISGTIGGSGTTNVIPKFTSSTAIGNSILSDDGSSIFIGQGGSVSEYALQIGSGRSGNGYAYIDLIGDTTYSDYGLRLIRNNAGANTTSFLEHRGTGDLIIKTTESAQFKVQTASSDKLAIYANGQLRLNAYTSTTSFSGTAVGLLAYDGFGQVITQDNLPQSGNYTPTLTAGTNISATTAYNCQYIRIGNVVSVSGRLEADATTAGVTSAVILELPYNTTFTSADQCNGVLTAQDNICGIIYGNSTTASLIFTPANTGSFNYFFTLHFQII
jgi:hypothetical protein